MYFFVCVLNFNCIVRRKTEINLEKNKKISHVNINSFISYVNRLINVLKSTDYLI